MKGYPFLYLSLLFLLLNCGDQSPEESDFQDFIRSAGTSFDLLILGGNVLDGIAGSGRAADVLISGDEIKYIGKVDTSRIDVEQVIDAAGKVVSPGFIDMHAHGDPFATPDFDNFLAMGVTTICLGQDGSSPAVENLSAWMRQVDSAGTGVNIAMFVGHGTLRMLSGVGFEPDPAKADLDSMKQLLQSAMDAGCFGMTTGLEYTPGFYAQDPELLELAKVVGQNDGLIMSHVRNEDDDAIEASLRELLRQGQYCNVQVSHLKVVYGSGEERAREILALLDEARKNTRYSVTADIYPYTASYTGIGILFPTWAKAPNDYQEVKMERREELLAFLHDKVMARNGPEATLFGTAPFVGKTLKQVSQELEKPFAEVLLEVGPTGASGAYFVMNEELQSRLLADPFVMICSDGSPTMNHPRGYGSFARIIETYVEERSLFSLPEAIRKMSSFSAQTLGIRDRGSLQPGYKADILVFDPARVKANATFSDPHQLAGGFDWVIVNGQPAFQNGGVRGKSGRVLRK